MDIQQVSGRQVAEMGETDEASEHNLIGDDARETLTIASLEEAKERSLE